MGMQERGLTVSHNDDDMAGSIPAFGRGVLRPAHHAVDSLESPLGVGPRLQLVV